MQFIGQVNLLEQWNKKWLGETLPHFLILEGIKGQGKTSFIQHFCKMNNLSLVILDDLKVDSIRNLRNRANETADTKFYYLGDVDDNLTTQAANALLKITEEPPDNAYIVMSVKDISNILGTLKSRGQLYTLENYTPKEKGDFMVHNLNIHDGKIVEPLMDICTNLGQINELYNFGLEKVLKFCRAVYKNIGVVATVNIFNIGSHIDLKNDDETKIPLNLFFNTMVYLGLSEMQVSKESVVEYYYTIQAINKVLPLFRNKGLNKLALFDKFILDLRRIWGC